VKNHCEYTGIEGSDEVVNNLRAKGYSVLKSFIPPLPEISRKFDVCFMLHVIEHMNNIREAEQLLNGIHDILDQHGKVVIAIPDYQFWGKDFYNCDYTHNLPFTLKRLVQLLQNSGFKIDLAQHYVGSTIGIKGFIKFGVIRLLYSRTIDTVMKNSLSKDTWYRGYLTFIPNLFVIASKSQG
jgi:hypothetical protein